jgi:predicted Fe-Mo cluster-binding NifX family protein
MKISVAVTDAETMIIPEDLAEATCLLIIDMDKSEVISTRSQKSEENRDVFFASETVSWDCEAIICGNIDQTAFEILADYGVTRYYGVNHNALDAVSLMERYKLSLIREYRGGNGCQSEITHFSHDEGQCNCGQHDEE